MQRPQPESWWFARWAHIKRYSSDDLEHIHSIERTAYGRERMIRDRGELLPTGWLPWEAHAAVFMRETDVALGPFWPPRSEPDWINAQFMWFHKRIYPLWRPIWDRRVAAWEKIQGEDGYVSEISTLHQCDVAIHRADFLFPPKSNKPLAYEERMERLRAAAGDLW